MLSVFLYALLTAVATGLGALPFVFKKNITRTRHAKAHGLAAALMLAASFSLIYEGLQYTTVGLDWSWIGVGGSTRGVVAGMTAGLLFIVGAETWLSRYPDLSIENVHGMDAKKIILILGVMTVHSFAEGVAVGVSFGPSLSFGIFMALAIALHNIPEGLAISSVMTSKGVSWWKAGLWSIFSSLPQPLMAVPAYFFVQHFAPFLPSGLGFAAGAMIWMVIAELLPDAYQGAPKNTIATIVTIGIIAMLVFQGVVE